MCSKSKAKWMAVLAGGMMVLSSIGCVDGDDVIRDAGQAVNTAVEGVKDTVEAVWENGCNTGSANAGGCVIKDIMNP